MLGIYAKNGCLYPIFVIKIWKIHTKLQIPLEYARLALDEEMQAWVDAIDSLEVW